MPVDCRPTDLAAVREARRARTATSSGSGCTSRRRGDGPGRVAVRAPPARGRGRRRTPTSGPSSSATTTAVPGPQDPLVRRRARRRGDRRDQPLRRQRLRGDRAARRGHRAVLGTATSSSRPWCSGTAVGGDLRGVRPGGRRLRGGRRVAGVDVDEVEESVFSPARTDDRPGSTSSSARRAEMRRAALPLKDPMKRFASGSVPGVPEAAPFFRDVADHLARVAEPSTRSTACCPRPSTRTWPGSRCSRTTTCGRSPRGWRSPRSAP